MNKKTFLIALLVLTPVLFACQRMVEKEVMEAIGKWSTQMCKCAEMSDATEAKACADALKQPQLQMLNSSGRPQYKLDSVHAYGEIESIGVQCQMKVMGK